MGPTMTAQMKVLTLNCWCVAARRDAHTRGLKFLSKLRVERLRAIGDYLAQTDCDIIALQEIWVESQDWRYVRDTCAARYKHSKYFFTYVCASKCALTQQGRVRLRARGALAPPDRRDINACIRAERRPGSRTAGRLDCGEGLRLRHHRAPHAGARGRLEHPRTCVGGEHTHRQFTAVGGQVGGETQRAYRVSEAFELAEFCRASAERGRHVLCVGDLNSLPDSLCYEMLLKIGSLYDTAALPIASGDDPLTLLTCDTPQNTWTKGKHLDENALHFGGKRLDYVLYRGPATSPCMLSCVAHKVVLDELVPGMNVSYTDHYGVEASFAVEEAPAPTAAPRAAVMELYEQSLSVLRDALAEACTSQRSHIRAFVIATAFAASIIAAQACASVWLGHGLSAVPSVLLGVLLVAAAAFGTTALYSGVVWGEWQKRTCASSRRLTPGTLRYFLDRIETRKEALVLQ